MKRGIIFLCFVSITVPALAFGAVSFTEVMYKPNPNSGHEWVEIKNTGTTDIDFTYALTKHWKITENATEGGIKPYRGGNILPAGGYAVLAVEPDSFLADWPNWNGLLFDITSITSLTDDKGILILTDPSGANQDNFDYGFYAKDKIAYNADKNSPQMSLQKNSSGAWVAVSPTPGAGLTESNQNTVQSSSSSTSDQSSVSQTTNQSGLNLINWPVEPQIFAEAGKDKTVVVGATVTFEGSAYGLKKEPLDNARYIWNFGDGGVGEGRTVIHTYRHPGDYLVMLDVSSGYFSGSDEMKVHAEPSPLTISSITDGQEYFVEINNSSNSNIDVGGWWIALGNEKFEIPKNTLVMAGKRVVFGNETTGLSVNKGSAPELLYPNGTVAFVFGQARQRVVAMTVSENAAPVGAAGKGIIKKAQADEKEIMLGSQAATASKSGSFGSSKYIWYLGVLAIALVAMAGIFFLGRQEDGEDEAEKLAREIELVE